MYTTPCTFSLDSVLQANMDSTAAPRQSLFTGHELPMDHPTYRPRANTDSNDWIFGVLIVIIAIACIFLKRYQIKFYDLAKSTTSQRDLTHLMRENRFSRASSYFYISLLFSLSIGIFFSYFAFRQHVEQYFSVPMMHYRPILYLMLSASVLVCFALRNGLVKLLGNIFETPESTTIYLANTYTFALMETIVTIPCMFLLYFSHLSPHLYYLPAALILVLFIFRIIRGLQIILTNAKASKLYLFYYICTVEIVPPLIIAKVLFTL